MDNNLRPQDLPAFIDPLLDYLAEHLPPSLYDTLFTVLSYGLMLVSGLFSLVSSLPSLKPWEWDAQTILPPLIMFLTAYYTLLSLYRTTSFMVRMVFRVVKWILILGLLGATAGWFAGTNGEAGSPLDVFRDAIQGRGAPAAGNRGRPRQTRPRIYESFNAHQQWRYNEAEARRVEQRDAASDAQRFIQSVAGFAGRALGSLPLDVLSKTFFERLSNPAAGDSDDGSSSSGGQTRQQPNRKAKTSETGRRKTASR